MLLETLKSNVLHACKIPRNSVVKAWPRSARRNSKVKVWPRRPVGSQKLLPSCTWVFKQKIWFLVCWAFIEGKKWLFDTQHSHVFLLSWKVFFFNFLIAQTNFKNSIELLFLCSFSNCKLKVINTSIVGLKAKIIRFYIEIF